MRLCADYICDWLLNLFYITHTRTTFICSHPHSWICSFFYEHTRISKFFYNFVHSLLKKKEMLGNKQIIVVSGFEYF